MPVRRSSTVSPIGRPLPGHQILPAPKRGEKGDRGDRGHNGRDGVDGRDGVNGLPGVNGRDGTNGKDSTVPGPPGKSVTGPRGPQGDRGDRGETVVGSRGLAGERGLPGKSVAGPRGPQGIPGTQGLRGVPGISVKGDRGDSGPKGDRGVGAPTIWRGRVQAVLTEPVTEVPVRWQPLSTLDYSVFVVPVVSSDSFPGLAVGVQEGSMGSGGCTLLVFTPLVGVHATFLVTVIA